MVDIAQIGFAVDTSDLNKATVSLDRLTRTSKSTQSAISGVSSGMRQAAVQSPVLAGGMSRLGGAFTRMGPGIQNASFQLQDIIVQMQMGTPVARTLGQQLPQLLGGFGPLGAVLGVVAGGMASLIPILLSTSDAMDDASESADRYKAALEELQKAQMETTRLERERLGVFAGEVADPFAQRVEEAQQRLADLNAEYEQVLAYRRELIELGARESGLDVRAGAAQDIAEEIADAEAELTDALRAQSDRFVERNTQEVIKRNKEFQDELAKQGEEAAQDYIKQQDRVYQDAIRRMRSFRDALGTGSLVTGGPSESSALVFQRAKEQNQAMRTAQAEAERASVKYNQSLNNVLNSTIPLRAATQQYQSDLEMLNMAVQNGDISWQEYDVALRGIQDELKSAEDRLSGMDRFMQSAEGSIDSYFESFVTGTMSASDALKGFIIELGRAAQQQLIFQATGGQSSSFGGFGLQALSGLFGGGPAAATSATGGYIIAAPGGSFADGGSFTVGGQFPAASAGRDNRLVSFFARDGEQVSVSTPGKRMGENGVQVVNNINIDATTPVDQAVIDQSIARALPQITQASLQRVVNERQRNPRLFGGK